MKIIIASTYLPFVGGGGTKIVVDLARELRRRGHEVDEIMLPFSMEVGRLVEQTLALRLHDVADDGELLIAIRTPSYLLSHPNKVVWFIHHHRGAYDLWGTPYQDIPFSPEGLETRRMIVNADDYGLREARRVFSNSRVVSDRLWRYNRVRSEVLYPPLADTSGLRCESFGDYVFCPSRLDLAKRQRLLIESMAHVRSEVRLVLAGAASKPERVGELEQLIASLGVGERVELIGSWISEERKQELFANALACAYIPYGEDSYGYVTLESYHSLKPVVTCRDSGGTLEIVEDEVTGLVCEPEPQELAQAFDRLHGSPELARRLGRAGHERMLAMEISWEHVVERLLA